MSEAAPSSIVSLWVSVAVCALIWHFDPEATRHVSEIRCADKYTFDYRCARTIELTGLYRFEINKSTGVVFWGDETKSSFGSYLSDCHILNFDNWECHKDDKVFTRILGMRSGVFYQSLSGLGPPDYFYSGIGWTASKLLHWNVLTIDQAIRLDRMI